MVVLGLISALLVSSLIARERTRNLCRKEYRATPAMGKTLNANRTA